MAKATSTYEVTLTLNKDEAQTLLAIFMRIGGCPTRSRRAHVEAMARELHDAGVTRGDACVSDNQPCKGSIYF